MLKIKIIEPSDKILKLLENLFNGKIKINEDYYDLKIIYTKDVPTKIEEKTIYLCKNAEYGIPENAGKIFGNIDYDSITATLDDNEYYIREFIYYFRTKFLKEYSIAFAEVAITPKCNLKCVHCCIADIEKKEMPTFENYKSFFDQFKAQGGLEITFTGR